MSHQIVHTSPPKLSATDRNAAVQAIAANARGNPVEVALQILAGIAALDGDFGSPFVMLWPAHIYNPGREDSRAEWYSLELKRLQDQEKHWQAVRNRNSTPQTPASLESVNSDPEPDLQHSNPLKPTKTPEHPEDQGVALSVQGGGGPAIDVP